jgi:hypothetical protein
MRPFSWALVAVVLLSVSGCGHPASVAECEEIVTRIARLELEKQYPHNPKAVERETESTKKALKKTTMKDCVGKRITESAMKCVKNAKTSKEIVDKCFD